jgi:hypothetical protein
LRRLRCTHNPNGFRAIREGQDVTNGTSDDLSQMAHTLEKSGD